MKTAALWVCIAACSLAVWLHVASDSGDLWGRWTDHRRHVGEAIAFQHHGFELYTQTYDDSTRGLTLPCPAHEHLWGATGVPYPPLGVLVHWPMAQVEAHGVLSPAVAHKVIVWLFGFAGLLTTWLGARLLNGWRRWLFVVMFGPLLVGVGFSGFYDTMYALAAVLAVTHGRRWAVLAYLLHFRGAVVLTLHSWRRAWGALVLTALNTVVAVVASQHLGVFKVTNRLHGSWWFPALTALVCWIVRKEGLALPLAVTGALVFFDRQRAFWHMLLLLPVVLQALRTASTRTALLITAWAFMAAQRVLDAEVPFNVLWFWLRAP